MRHFVSIFLSLALLCSVCFAYESEWDGAERPADISWPLLDGYEFIDILECSEDEYPDFIETLGCSSFFMYQEIDGVHLALIPTDFEFSDGDLVVYVIDMDAGIDLLANPTTPIETLKSCAGGAWQAYGAASNGTIWYLKGYVTSSRAFVNSDGNNWETLMRVLTNVFAYYDSQLANVLTDSNLTKLETYMKLLYDKFSISPNPTVASGSLTSASNVLNAINLNLYEMAQGFIGSGNYAFTSEGTYKQLNQADNVLSALLNSFVWYAIRDTTSKGTTILDYDGSEAYAGTAMSNTDVTTYGFRGLGSLIRLTNSTLDIANDLMTTANSLQTAANDAFANAIGTTSWSGSIPAFSSAGTQSTAYLSDAKLFDWIRMLNQSVVYGLSSDPDRSVLKLLRNDGLIVGASSASIGRVVNLGFMGLQRLLVGEENVNKFTFPVYGSNIVEVDGTYTIESEDVEFTGIWPTIGHGFSQLSYQVGLLDAIFASESDLELKEETEENRDAVSDGFLKPGSPGSVSSSDISDLSGISGTASGLVDTGVSPMTGLSQLNDSSFWSFFSQETESSLNSFVVPLSELDDPVDYGHAYEDNLAELYSIIGLGVQ